MRTRVQASLFLAAIAFTLAAQPRALAQSTENPSCEDRAPVAQQPSARQAKISQALQELGGRAAARAATEARQKGEKSLCVPTAVGLCLLGRFIVVAVWDNPFSAPGVIRDAGALQLTPESGYMWFLDPLDMEVPIKILDFCGGQNGAFPVFAAGLTDFGVGIGVKDLISGIQKNYINPDLAQFNTIIDAQPPFPCP